MTVGFFLRDGRIGSALLGGAAVAEHQQQVAAAVEGGRGNGADDGKRLPGVVDHLIDRGHRVACRKALAEAGADQQVALLDVGGVGHMAQFQPLGIAGTAGNGAQAVAIDLHRDAVGRVGQQQHARRVGHQLDHLAHQPTRIEHRLAKHHAIALALVDQDAMGERVGIDADQLGHLDLLVDQRRGVEQFAQAHVLFGQGSQLLQAPLQQQGLGLELLVFGGKLGAAAKLAGNPLPQALRHIGDGIGFHQHQPHLAAHWLEHGKARIDHHQGDRQHDQNEQTNPQ
ncbi:hypothetical protein PS627_02391 [Pseudomonas fluorescens]|nr:hypothetical protein PS627_02391 [Pseudomonas fluorescens]